MAQPMTGRDSALRAISNTPISIFAEEKKRMTSPKPTAEATPETPATVDETPTGETPATTPVDLAALVAQRKALDAAIKTAKAALPARSKLELVIEHQEAHAADVIAQTKVVGRIKAGQSRDEAIAAVVELTRKWLEQEIPAE
jgi:hypothetical protein